jgi:hypothetical protein
MKVKTSLFKTINKLSDIVIDPVSWITLQSVQINCMERKFC